MNTAAKTLFAALAAAAGLAAVAGPAAAQDWRYDHFRGDRGYERGYEIDARQARLADRIEDGVRDGSLTWREARELREQASDIARLEARYRYDGLNGWERADLDRRLDQLDRRIRYERHDDDYREYRRW